MMLTERGRDDAGQSKRSYSESLPPVKDASVWLTSELALQLLDMAPGSVARVSLDLGLSTQPVEREGTLWRTPGTTLSEATLRQAASLGDAVGLVTGQGTLLRLALVHEGRYFQLVATRTAPTVMISGVQMHRRDDPWADARAKVLRVVKPGDWVLDTCGGLGYTAAWSLNQGASLVVSTEPDPAVRWLRSLNPWSPRPGPGLRLHTWDAEFLLNLLPSGCFDVVVHDPPRFALAGALYGRAFYASLRRVVRSGARLYHYTGLPYAKRRGMSFVHQTIRRLKESGFEVEWDSQTGGVVGVAT